jgi:hypothetical protein
LCAGVIPNRLLLRQTARFDSFVGRRCAFPTYAG